MNIVGVKVSRGETYSTSQCSCSTGGSNVLSSKCVCEVIATNSRDARIGTRGVVRTYTVNSWCKFKFTVCKLFFEEGNASTPASFSFTAVLKTYCVTINQNRRKGLSLENTTAEFHPRVQPLLPWHCQWTGYTYVAKLAI